MLEQIAQLVKQYGQQAVVDNAAVPNDLNNQVMAEATSTITGGLQNMLAGGGLQNIISMFSGQGQNKAGLMSNPIVSMMVGHFASKLMGKFNLNPSLANGIANNIIPNVFNSLVSKTVSNDPSNSGFNLNDLIASFTGGNAAASNQGGGFDFQGLLNQFTQGGAPAQQQSGFENIVNTIAQQVQQTQQGQQGQNQGGGFLGDLVKGFFK